MRGQCVERSVPFHLKENWRTCPGGRQRGMAPSIAGWLERPIIANSVSDHRPELVFALTFCWLVVDATVAVCITPFFVAQFAMGDER